MARLQGKPLAVRHQCSRLHPEQLHPLRRRRILPGRADRCDDRTLESGAGPAEGRTGQGRRARLRNGSGLRADGLRPGLHRQGHQGSRKNRRPPDGQTAETGLHALRRLQNGQGSRGNLRLSDQSEIRSDLQRISQDPQPGSLRRLHPGNAARPPRPHCHRAAGYLWPRPYRRRLPPRGAVRRGLFDRKEGRRQAELR